MGSRTTCYSIRLWVLLSSGRRNNPFHIPSTTGMNSNERKIHIQLSDGLPNGQMDAGGSKKADKETGTMLWAKRERKVVDTCRILYKKERSRYIESQNCTRIAYPNFFLFLTLSVHFAQNTATWTLPSPFFCLVFCRFLASVLSRTFFSAQNTRTALICTRSNLPALSEIRLSSVLPPARFRDSTVSPYLRLIF